MEISYKEGFFVIHSVVEGGKAKEQGVKKGDTIFQKASENKFRRDFINEALYSFAAQHSRNFVIKISKKNNAITPLKALDQVSDQTF